MVKAVIFDLDGTLLNTLGDLTAAVNFALAQRKHPLRSEEEVRSFVGSGVKVLMERSLPSGTGEDEAELCLNLFREYYLTHMNVETRPYPGTIELLEELQVKGIACAVVSNKLHEAVCRLCNEYFCNCLSECFGMSCAEERKPSPANVFKALVALEASPDEALYVGDSGTDVQTAANAGIRFIGVSWGFRSRDELEAAGTERIICKPEQLMDEIRAFDIDNQTF